jgi:hypothetical protein
MEAKAMDRTKPETPGTSPAQDAHNRQQTPGNVSGQDTIISEGQEQIMEKGPGQQLTKEAGRAAVEECRFMKCRFEALLSSWGSRDYEACKETLLSLCEQIGYGKIQKLFLTCTPRVAWFLDMFRKTGIHNTSESEDVKTFYSCLRERFEAQAIPIVLSKEQPSCSSCIAWCR